MSLYFSIIPTYIGVNERAANVCMYYAEVQAHFWSSLYMVNIIDTYWFMVKLVCIICGLIGYFSNIEL